MACQARRRLQQIVDVSSGECPGAPQPPATASRVQPGTTRHNPRGPAQGHTTGERAGRAEAGAGARGMRGGQ